MLDAMHKAAAPHPWLARAFGAWVHQVSGASLRADLLAGLLGAVLVLPQGIAFATLAGLPPESLSCLSVCLCVCLSVCRS